MNPEKDAERDAKEERDECQGGGGADEAEGGIDRGKRLGEKVDKSPGDGHHERTNEDDRFGEEEPQWADKRYSAEGGEVGSYIGTVDGIGEPLFVLELGRLLGEETRGSAFAYEKEEEREDACYYGSCEKNPFPVRCLVNNCVGDVRRIIYVPSTVCRYICTVDWPQYEPCRRCTGP
jgi:hypothetical protein